MSNRVERTVLIDDSDIDLFIQRRFLEVYQFSEQLIEYKSAHDALLWLTKADEKSAPDVIFLDLNMPEMDGFSFLQSFSELKDGIRKKVRIVVLTSSSSSQDREKALNSSNVIQFITKPLKQADIEQLRTIVFAPSEKTS